LLFILSKEVVGEGCNGGIRPKVCEVSNAIQFSYKMDIALVGFTLSDEPYPPLMGQLVVYHIFYKLKRITQVITGNTHENMRTLRG